jgi:hypothetical protein
VDGFLEACANERGEVVVASASEVGGMFNNENADCFGEDVAMVVEG